MKTTSALLAAAALALPALPTMVSAKEYGDFKPGYTFTKRVIDVDTVRYSMWDTDEGVSIPGDVPNYRQGSRVKFTIGKKGHLTARDGLKLEYLYERNGRNYYGDEDFPDKFDSGSVRKRDNDTAGKVRLKFVRIDWSWTGREVTEVTYTLK